MVKKIAKKDEGETPLKESKEMQKEEIKEEEKKVRQKEVPKTQEEHKKETGEEEKIAVGKKTEGEKVAFEEPVKAVTGKVHEALEFVKGMNSEEKGEFGISMIKELSVIELSRWVKSLEEEFGISAQAPVAVASAPAGAPGEGGAAQEEKKDSFTVMLVAAGDKKIQVIKEVRTITSLGLREAKALVDEAPKPVKEGVDQKEASEIKAKLEAAGATVELK